MPDLPQGRTLDDDEPGVGGGQLIGNIVVIYDSGLML